MVRQGLKDFPDLKDCLVSEDHLVLPATLVFPARKEATANLDFLEALDKRARKADEDEEDLRATEERSVSLDLRARWERRASLA